MASKSCARELVLVTLLTMLTRREGSQGPTAVYCSAFRAPLACHAASAPMAPYLVCAPAQVLRDRNEARCPMCRGFVDWSSISEGAWEPLTPS